MSIKRSLMLVCAAAIAGLAGSVTANARECKTETVTAEGDVATLRDLGAYPSSLFAWRTAVKDKFGAEWNSWRYAQDGTVDCKEITSGDKKGWKCTRVAKPCKDTLTTVVEQATKKKDCKAEAISSTGSRKKSEKEAIEESQSAWKIDTRKKHGKEWATLENADGQDQDCRKVSKQFQCITVATPCKAP